MYDTRISAAQSMVAQFTAGTSRVLNTQFMPQNRHEFITGSTSGEVMLWDARQKGCTLKIDSGIEANMTGFHIHPHAPLIAW